MLVSLFKFNAKYWQVGLKKPFLAAIQQQHFCANLFSIKTVFSMSKEIIISVLAHGIILTRQTSPPTY